MSIAEYVGAHALDDTGSGIISGVTFQISLDGGAFAAPTNTATHVQNGYWRVQLTASERGNSQCDVQVFGGGAIPQTRTFVNIPEAPANFADLAITASTGRVTVGTNTDKSGYSLAADQSSVTIGELQNCQQIGPGGITPLSYQVNAISAGAIAAGALNGKGDWNIGKTDYQISGTKKTLDALNDVSQTQVKEQVDASLKMDTKGEVSGAPPVANSIEGKVGWLYSLARNRVEQTATTQSLRNDANSGNLATAAVSDDGSTFVRDEWGT